MNNHKIKNNVCEKCGGSERSLTTYCPEVMHHCLNKVSHGGYDYRLGEGWVDKLSPTAQVDAEKFITDILTQEEPRRYKTITDIARQYVVPPIELYPIVRKLKKVLGYSHSTHILDENLCYSCGLYKSQLTTDCSNSTSASKKLKHIDYRGNGWLVGLRPQQVEELAQRLRHVTEVNTDTLTVLAEDYNLDNQGIHKYVEKILEEKHQRFSIAETILLQGLSIDEAVKASGIPKDVILFAISKLCTKEDKEHNWIKVNSKDQYCTKCCRLKSKLLDAPIAVVYPSALTKELNVYGKSRVRNDVTELLDSSGEYSKFNNTKEIAEFYAIREEVVNNIAKEILESYQS